MKFKIKYNKNFPVLNILYRRSRISFMRAIEVYIFHLGFGVLWKFKKIKG